jgi:alkanesulfonate monooxygenase SsuD/methylene tetrahydromethanopterin reductase-like flavin-dependent oxidoreductase (luciferase family)
VDRLAESLSIMKSLLGGEKVNFTGSHYRVENASIAPAPVQRPVPVLIAAGQRRLLELAAREADIIALAVQQDEGADQIAERVGWIRAAAGERFSQLEININLMAVAGQVPRQVAMTRGEDFARQVAESDAIPVLKGTVDQMCARLEWLRDTFSINYILVADQMMDALAPVVARLAR